MVKFNLKKIVLFTLIISGFCAGKSSTDNYIVVYGTHDPSMTLYQKGAAGELADLIGKIIDEDVKVISDSQRQNENGDHHQNTGRGHPFPLDAPVGVGCQQANGHGGGVIAG